MRSMVHKAFEQIRETGRVRLFRSDRPEFADGEQRRDFLYVKDAVAMTLHVGEQPALNGLVNVGSGRAHTWVELMRAVFAALGAPPQIEFVDMPAHLRGKYQVLDLRRDRPHPPRRVHPPGDAARRRGRRLRARLPAAESPARR